VGYFIVVWIAVGILLAVWLIMAWRYRNARLDRLALLDGETICFDDDQARYAVIGRRPTRHAPRFARAIVRVTSERLIVAEPSGRIARLRWAVYHAGPVPNGMGDAWTDGYVSFATSASCVSVELRDARRVLSLAPVDGASPVDGVPERISVESPRLGEYLAVLRSS
jgi:hypothetical protein